MTKVEFLKRCETAYNLIGKDRRRTSLLRDALDAIMRYESSLHHPESPRAKADKESFESFIADEIRRTQNFKMILANDHDLYALICVAAILDHPCQQCAEDPDAWHTRYAFCEHKK